jgi:mono/diheme cytochrome c family protein
VGGGIKGQVLMIDTSTGNTAKTAAAGHTPTCVALSPDGTKLFVCNQFTNDVCEYSLPDLKLTRTIKVVREPRAAVVTKDGKYLLVANSIPLMPTNFPDDENADIYVAAEVTIINIASGESKPLLLPNGSGALHGMCMSPDGRYVYITEIIARFLLPTTQVERGWMNTAGIAVIDTTQIESKSNGFVNSVLIDDVDMGAANPWGITTSADGKKIYVAVAGTSELIAIDAVEMHKKLDDEAASRANQAKGYGTEVSDNLAFLAGLKKRIRLPGKGARAVTVAGNSIYVGMYFSDTLQKLDETQLRPAEIALASPPFWTAARRGEIYWNDATLCFQQWQSCASCHPDARMDGYNWDLLNDGQGNPKNAKSLLFSHKTPPTMWEAVRDNPNPTDPTKAAWFTETQGIECIRTGFKWILFTVPDEAKCQDIDAYLAAEKPVPSPYLVDGKLSAKAERGKKIFEDPKVGCATCHLGPYFTDQKMHDVNTRCYYDRTGTFDTPTLIEVWRTAPYLHDGRYVNMKDVFKLGLHGDVSGDVGGLTDEQLDELVEYVMSL